MKKSVDEHPLTFTFITVTYNAEETLGRTLRSVAEQTYPHIEHILIDGASKDRTLEIARLHGAHLTKVVSEPDKGLYDAMNKGLRLATGDYVCFLNAGDKLHERETVERIVDKLRATSYKCHPDGELVTCSSSLVASYPGVLYGHTDIVDNKGCYLRHRRLSPPKHLTWKSFKQGMLVCHQAFYARRDLCLEYDTTFRFSADFDWCIRVMRQTDNLLHLPFTVTDYLSEGVTTQNHHASLIERFRIMCKYYGILQTVIYHAWFVIRGILRK